MKVRVPMMIQDPLFGRYENLKSTEGFDIAQEDFFLDGPVTRRVAVLDFDPQTGVLLPGVPFRPAPPGRKLGRYQIADEDNLHAPDFIAVSAFATVLKTMYMYEEADTLGRRLAWAFKGPQLLVLPRAGQWANAYYERDSHSLQFFYFPHPERPGETIYTSLSRDIIAHETAHAILDGIAPHLYDAITPQSLALHEAIADLTAVLSAFRSGQLRKAVLRQTGGSIQDSTAFNTIAQEFGMARSPGAESGSLRSLLNDKTLADVSRSDPHALSEVLSGALYTVMVHIHRALRAELAAEEGRTEYSASGKALWLGGERFKRMILRALDYLPPGEVSFADYGRAILAADQASHPDDDREREWIIDEFVRRGMAPDRQALEVETNFPHAALQEVDLDTLVESDWAAYDFANRNRDLLGIPQGVPFQVEPRLDVSKDYYRRGGQVEMRECLFKVWWDQSEPNPPGSFFPRRRAISVGTTLAIDWDTRRVRARLTSDHSARPQEQDEQQADRDAMLHRLADAGLLGLGSLALGPDGRPLRSVVGGQVADGLMRVRGAARMLHIIGEV
ncbi:MAG: hypothetical protein Kow0063_16220 [Anaerolineae bacterium]